MIMSLIGRVPTNIRYCKHVNGFYNSINGIHMTSVRLLDQEWRRRHRLTRNPNKFGPLTNLPDYSFADGRPVPFGVRQLTRINEQREILKRVRTLTFQVDYAVERHARIQREKEEERRRILESKLKPKGNKLLIESEKKLSEGGN